MAYNKNLELFCGTSVKEGSVEFQWKRNGRRLRNASRSNFALKMTKASEYGEYRCEVRYRGETLLSDPAHVTHDIKVIISVFALVIFRKRTNLELD